MCSLVKVLVFHCYPLLEQLMCLGKEGVGEKFPFLKCGSGEQYTVDTERLIFFLIYRCHLFPQLHLNFKMVE